MKSIPRFFVVALLLINATFSACATSDDESGFTVELPSRDVFWGSSRESETIDLKIANISEEPRDFKITSDWQIEIQANCNSLKSLKQYESCIVKIKFLEKPSRLYEERSILIDSGDTKKTLRLNIYRSIFLYAGIVQESVHYVVSDGKVQIPIDIGMEKPGLIECESTFKLEARLSTYKARIVEVNGKKVGDLPIVTTNVIDNLSIDDPKPVFRRNTLTIEIDGDARLPLSLKIRFYPDIKEGFGMRYPDAPKGSLDFGYTEVFAVNARQFKSQGKSIIWKSDDSGDTQSLVCRTGGYAVFKDYSGYSYTKGYEVFDDATGKRQLFANFSASAVDSHVFAKTSYTDDPPSSRIDEAWLLDKNGLVKLSLPVGASYVIALGNGFMIISSDMSFVTMDKRFISTVSKGRFNTRENLDFDPFEQKICCHKDKIFALVDVQSRNPAITTMFCFDSNDGRLLWEKPLGIAYGETYFSESDPKVVQTSLFDALAITTRTGTKGGFWEYSFNLVNSSTGECVGYFGKATADPAQGGSWFNGSFGNRVFGIKDRDGSLIVCTGTKVVKAAIKGVIDGRMALKGDSGKVLLVTGKKQMYLYNIDKGWIVWEREVPSANFEIVGNVIAVSYLEGNSHELISMINGETLATRIDLDEIKALGSMAVGIIHDKYTIIGVDPIKGIVWEKVYGDLASISIEDVFPQTNQLAIGQESKDQAKSMTFVDGSSGADLKNPRMPEMPGYNPERYAFCQFTAYSEYSMMDVDCGIGLFDKFERRVVWSEKLIDLSNAKFEQLRVYGQEGNRVYVDKIACLDLDDIMDSLE